MSLRPLIRQLREALGSGSFMGGGASYPGPEPGMLFTRMVSYPGVGTPPEDVPQEKQPPGREREEKRGRRPLKYLGRKKDDDAKGQGSAG